jgi:hypothetical protein
MRGDGPKDLKDGRLIPGPWWFNGVFAAVVGFGTVQDNVRRLHDSARWGLAGRWVLIVGGGAILVIHSWAAVAKFRVRHLDAG